MRNPAIDAIAIDELLLYVQYYRNCASVDELHNIIVCFYQAAEISEEKKKLTEHFVSELADCPLKLLVVSRQTVQFRMHRLKTFGFLSFWTTALFCRRCVLLL